ncbi:hypothetical protein FPSE_11257, partial [Fusarium pseudograminearum CS3096]
SNPSNKGSSDIIYTVILEVSREEYS